MDAQMQIGEHAQQALCRRPHRRHLRVARYQPGQAPGLPAAALISFIIARRTTRCVEQLAAAAETQRAGNYGSWVLSSGDDELSLLQGPFNAMAADLERTVGELAAERDRVSALLEARRQLVAAVSHELCTPVATTCGYLASDLTRWAGEAPMELHDDLMIMAREAERLQRLIDDLFTLARADAGGLPLAFAPIDVAGLAREVAATMAPLAWRSLRVTVLADQSRLEQILVNLAHNAVRIPRWEASLPSWCRPRFSVAGSLRRVYGGFQPHAPTRMAVPSGTPSRGAFPLSPTAVAAAPASWRRGAVVTACRRAAP